MKVDKFEGYMSQEMRERLDSPKYAYKTWLNREEDNKEDVLQEFFDFLARDIICEDKKEENKIKRALEVFKEAMPLFVSGVDMKKVKQGELEMLQAWKDAVK